MRFPGEMKSIEHYTQVFKIEAEGKLAFYRKDIETRVRNLKRLNDELTEEKTAKKESEDEILKIEERLSNPDIEAKKLLFKDFRAAVAELLHGQEAQSGGRFGLRIETSGPFKIEKPVSVSKGGKRVTEIREVSIMRYRNNEGALIAFQDYLRQAGAMVIDTLSFDELVTKIEQFFAEAPAVNVYGSAYEEVVPAKDSEAALFAAHEKATAAQKSLFKY